MIVKNQMKKNKSGWIRIIEALFMIVVITGFILVILNKDVLVKDDSDAIYLKEHFILKEIQSNATLRDSVLNSSVPLEWNSFPAVLQAKINQTQDLNCVGKICAISDICSLTGTNEDNLYAQSIMITSNINKYEPKKLKVFCWKK
ncbi:hypothetical protein HY448_02295 [Candidatus Pacearchaeota archaeon]|nr:hypothetical protein [Candidatus Pacearchaeota archaeon]